MADFSGFRGSGVLSRREEEERGGILSSILRTIGEDLKGTAKVGAATAFLPFDLLGAEVPVEFDDLGVRDWVGAASIASMFVGGFGAAGARSVLAGQGLRGLGKGAAREATEAWARQIGAASNAAIFAGAEATAGAFFGASKLVIGAEEDLDTIWKDAALFGTLGGGFSLLGSAARATIGGRLAQMKGTTKAALLQETAKRREASRALGEFAGIRLRNPESGVERSIHRLENGAVRVREQGRGVVQDFESFNQALDDSFRSGFNDRLGLSRERLSPSVIRESLPEEVLQALDAADGDLNAVVDKLHFANYKATKEAAKKASEESAIWTWLGAEVSFPSDALGLPKIAPDFRREVLQAVPANVAKRMAKVEDPSEFLRQAVLEGAVDVEGLWTGAQMRNFADELFFNDLVPEASIFAAHTPYDATFLAKLATPQGLAKIHPEIKPLADLGAQASDLQILGQRDVKEFLFRIENEVSPKSMQRGMEIIEASANVGGIRAAREEALRLARETGDPEVISFVEQVSERLNHARLRYIAAGRLGGSDAPKEAVDAARAAIARALEAGGDSEAIEQAAISLAGGTSKTIPVVGIRGTARQLKTGEITQDLAQQAENGKLLPAVISDEGTIFTRRQAAEHGDLLSLYSEEGTFTNPHVRGWLTEDGRYVSIQDLQQIYAPEIGPRPANVIEPPKTGAGDVINELLDDAGLAGYFPIVHTGQVRVDINGIAEPAFFESFNEARKFLVEEHAERGGFISNSSFATDGTAYRTVSGKEFGNLVKVLRNVEGVEISASEAAALLKESGTLPSAGPRKFSRHLQKRRLGSRDFAESPIRALDLYLMNTERTLAYNTFEREANRIIENIPAAKGALKRWAEDQKNLLLGRPTTSEEIVSKVFASIAPGEVSRATLRRYSGYLRWMQGLSKLGGGWSGVVNLTQFATNTVTKLGVRWTAVGAEGFLNPIRRREVESLLAKHKVNLGIHTSLTREGELVGAETVGRELKAAAIRIGKANPRGSAKATVQALENMWMYSFNTFERMNRLGTFWGAFKKASSEGMGEEAAVAYAKKITLDTQFDYSVANLPQLLQGPVGGVIGQFKTFFINEMEFIAGLTPKERVKLALTFQALGGAGAILAVPGLDLADAASRHFFDVKASEAIKLEGAPEDSGPISRFLAFGAPGLFNIDMTNYIGPGGFEQLTMGLLGPTVSDLDAWRRFFGQALSDVKATGYLQPPTINSWLQQVMPAQWRRFSRSAAIFETGEVRNPYSGKLLYRPESRLKAAGREVLGAPSVRTATDRIQDDILARETEEYRNARESYRRQLAIAAINGNQIEVTRLRERAASAGYVFRPADIRRAVQAFNLTAAQRRERRTPVALRTEFEEFFEEF